MCRIEPKVRKPGRGAKSRSTQPEEPSTSKAPAAVSEVAKKHLAASLTDRSNPLGRITQEQWKVVEMKLLEALFAKIDADPSATMPTFDGAGWVSGVKIIKCKDDLTLIRVKETVKRLQGLWEGASVEIVDRSCIPTIPKAKVLIPRTVNPEYALKLLQRQNTDVPTDDWKMLKVAKSASADGGQNCIIQINKTTEDILYARLGKSMA
ncbi:uncharacterized protein LOC129250447 [Anastrepha obliqua]|uniref:uncharacterized protein LOC129250447 n=1 Tax=Anastrepha obliqua TaxID=95512 RepID=UPI00240A3211|nr:uncharacterized protein LOC129250447 [Anastrepha obliqua]